MKKTVVFWVIVAILALGVNSTFAKGATPSFVDGAWSMPAGNVPTFSSGKWTMPPRPVASLMQYSGYGGGTEQWRAEVDAACAVHGCSTDYILSVMACESGGNPNAVGPNGELGLMQIDPAYWGYYGPIESIWFAAEHLTAGDIYWSCA
jgi:hypothetical protein